VLVLIDQSRPTRKEDRKATTGRMVLFMALGGLIALVVVFLMILANNNASNRSKNVKSKAKVVLEQRRAEKRHYSMEEVARHCVPEEDVWIVVRYGDEKRVYDITEYADMHPGGDVIYDSAGKDATDKFNGPQHPPTVHDLIDEYWIGWVADDGKKDA